jgi:hypothetical protein
MYEQEYRDVKPLGMLASAGIEVVKNVS